MASRGVTPGDGYGGYRAELVETLRRKGIRDLAVLKAVAETPRHRFVPESVRHRAYEDSALPIGGGQTISQPFVQARYLEVLALTGREKVLEVGTGSGYNAALLAAIVGPEGVVSIERHPELVTFAKENLAAAGFGGVTVVEGDGTLGHAPRAPYDRIVVTAGAPRIARSWVRQTKLGGRILAPLGRSTFSQVLVIATKTGEDAVSERRGTPCAFVPLIGKEGW